MSPIIWVHRFYWNTVLHSVDMCTNAVQYSVQKTGFLRYHFWYFLWTQFNLHNLIYKYTLNNFHILMLSYCMYKNIFYYFIYRQFHIIFLYVHLSCCRGLSVLSGLNIKVIKSHLDRNLKKNSYWMVAKGEGGGVVHRSLQSKPNFMHFKLIHLYIQKISK